MQKVSRRKAGQLRGWEEYGSSIGDEEVVVAGRGCSISGGLWSPLLLGPYLLSLKTMTTRFLQSDSSLLQDYVYSEPVSAWGREPDVKAFLASGRAQQG